MVNTKRTHINRENRQMSILSPRSQNKSNEITTPYVNYKFRVVLGMFRPYSYTKNSCSNISGISFKSTNVKFYTNGGG